jgi:hypothetical protein
MKFSVVREVGPATCVGVSVSNISGNCFSPLFYNNFPIITVPGFCSSEADVVQLQLFFEFAVSLNPEVLIVLCSKDYTVSFPLFRTAKRYLY